MVEVILFVRNSLPWYLFALIMPIVDTNETLSKLAYNLAR
jgi:hypothetical protein